METPISPTSDANGSLSGVEPKAAGLALTNQAIEANSDEVLKAASNMLGRIDGEEAKMKSSVIDNSGLVRLSWSKSIEIAVRIAVPASQA